MNRKPTDWDDDVKMNVLFSPFRDKNLNPKAWDQKVKFWSELITAEFTEKKQAIVDVDLIRETFRRNGRSPTCIKTILQEMLRLGQLKRLCDVEDQQTEGWWSWGYKKLVKDPVGWGVKWFSKPAQQDTEEKFVLVDVIEDKARTMVETRARLAQDEVASVVEYSDLQEQFSGLCPTEVEFNLVLRELCRSKQAALLQKDNNTKYVKFIHPKKTPKKEETIAIDEKDIHIHKIQKAVSVVKKQIEALVAEMERLGDEAVSYKKQGVMKLAMSSMRKRKMAQNRIDKLTGSLDTLNDILYRIQQAESNEMILRAIEGGSNVLKDLTSKTTTDEVANIMDNLADVTVTQDDIMTELSTSTYIDEPSQEELEDELSAILDDSGPKVTPVTSTLDKSTDIERELEEILKLDNGRKDQSELYRAPDKKSFSCQKYLHIPRDKLKLKSNDKP